MWEVVTYSEVPCLPYTTWEIWWFPWSSNDNHTSFNTDVVRAICSRIYVCESLCKFSVTWSKNHSSGHDKYWLHVWIALQTTVQALILWTHFPLNISATVGRIHMRLSYMGLDHQNYSSYLQFYAFSRRPRVNMTTGYWDIGTKLSLQTFWFYCNTSLSPLLANFSWHIIGSY